jgi:hypothetical protein
MKQKETDIACLKLWDNVLQQLFVDSTKVDKVMEVTHYLSDEDNLIHLETICTLTGTPYQDVLYRLKANILQTEFNYIKG